jgi:hypothetical protein
VAARTNVDDLKSLIESDKEDEALEAFVDIANLLVNEQLVGKGLSDAMLTKIELYLAAHFLAVVTELGGLVRDSYGSASVQLSDVYGPGLGSTRFGQTALVLDTTATLQRISTVKNRAEFRLVSTVNADEEE